MMNLNDKPRGFRTLSAIAILVGVFLVSSSMNSPRNRLADRPNVIIILMDDLGYGDLASYGGMPYQTPHIDKLAAGGMRYTHFYAAQAVCSASRAALLTGCYPNRVGIYGALMPWSPIALHPDEETIASVLKQAGYRTGMVGKWHLGAKAPYLPLHYGFDEYLGLPYSNDMWPVDYDGRPVTDSTERRYRYPRLPLLEGDEAVDYINTLDDQARLTQLYTERACEFVTRNKERRFFLYLAHSMVHVPLAASPAFAGHSGAGLFGDVMTEVDWSVGRIMETLTKENLDKNTLVIFTSDNGPWLNFGNHAGNSGGLREGKGTTWEGGQRVPCIMHWPDWVPAGTVSNKLAATIDLLPTIAHLCGAPLPTKKIDGVNLSSLLRNEPDANPRDELAYYYHQNSLEAVRKGQWKLVFPHPSRTYTNIPPGQDGYPSKLGQVNVPMALYDLRTDPGETRDVQSIHPDMVRQLERVADRYRRELGDDLTDTPCSACRSAAAVEN